jgi:hypothetical protein
MANVSLQPSALSITPAHGQAFKALQSHPFVPAESNKMLLEMFGRPDGPYVLSNEALQRNLQPDDILGQYIGRELKLVSSAVTAAVANDRSAIMLLIFPIVETLETQFSLQYLEPNIVPWSRVTNFGIPREFTYSQWQEAYTTERKKQMARIEKNFLLDPNYGPQYWDIIRRGLGLNAKATLIIDACIQAVEQPLRNMFQDMNKRNAVDHNRLFNAEMADFGVAQRNPDMFYRALIRQRIGQVPVNYDTVLAPEGCFQQLKENALDGGPVPCERAELSRETGRIQRVVFDGPSSTKRIVVGGRTVELIEVSPLYCNMQDTTVKVFRPFETTLVYADVIPLDNGSSGMQEFTKPIPERNDVFAYAQTPTSGHQARFEFRRALDHCFLYDSVSGERSVYYRTYVEKLNREMAQFGRHVPPEWNNTTDINQEPVHGVDRFTPEMVKDVKTGDLKAIRGFRDQWPFATFDPLQRRWREPLHMGDFHQRQLTNERVRQSAKLVLSKLSKDDTSTAVFNDIVDLVSAIRRQNWTADYVAALIAANQPYLLPGGSYLPDAAKRNASDNVPQWTPNEFGSLRLPSGSLNLNVTYPPGFGSWSGIQTLALEADNAESVWRYAGEHARRVVAHVEHLYTVLAQYIPESELIDGRNTAPWFHVDDGGRSVLLDTIVQLKTGERRPGPVNLTAAGAQAEGAAAPALATKSATISDAQFNEDLKTQLENGTLIKIDAWLELGSVVAAADMPVIKRIADLLADIKVKKAAIKDNKGVVTVMDGGRVEDHARRTILDNMGKNSVATNAAILREVDGILTDEDSKTGQSDEEKRGNKITRILQAIGQAKAVVVKKGDPKPAPLFDSDKREEALEKARDDQVRAQPVAPVVSGVTLRAPLEATANLRNGPVGGASAAPIGEKSPQAVQSGIDILAYPVALNAALAGARAAAAPVDPMQGVTSTSATSRSVSASQSYLEMLTQVMYGGQEEVERTASRSGRFVPSGMQEEETVKVDKGVLTIGGTDNALFGPWKARLAWLRNHVVNGIERLACLAILLSRNCLQTHIALCEVGARLLKLDVWRTGITTMTAALVRLIRGSSTAFTVMARASVLPGVESVTGDITLTGEFFHGIVFQNRRQIDLMPNAMLLRFVGGKGEDFVEVPEHLDLRPDQAPSGLVCASSENAYRVDYPRHLLNDNFYYQDNTVNLSPYRKVDYDGFMLHVLGKRLEGFSTNQIEKAFYSGNTQRSIIGNLAATYKFNETTEQFSNRTPGTAVVGEIELNTAGAWKGYNGGIFPVLAEDRATPN